MIDEEIKDKAEKRYFSVKLDEIKEKEEEEFDYTKQEEKIEAYVDGSCLLHTKNKNGGWGVVILVNGEEVKTLSGTEVNTTNQRMELTAAIKFLEVVKPRTWVTVYSDSAYVVTGITEWVHNWKTNGKSYANPDLWKELYDLTYNSEIKVSWKHVNGHSKIKYNERADHLAHSAAKSILN